MSNKKILSIVGILLVFAVIFVLSKNKDNSYDYDVKTGETQEMIEDYIRTNISTISPEKEVLGGKFYVTDISWDTTSSGIVEYEDGHIALKAGFEAEINEQNQVEIIEFLILPR
jgi:hypothetical protein